MLSIHNRLCSYHYLAPLQGVAAESSVPSGRRTDLKQPANSVDMSRLSAFVAYLFPQVVAPSSNVKR